MTHLYIEQNGITEEVSSSVISKLYELASSGTLDGTSDLKGRLHSNMTYRSYMEYLNTTYPDLYISADDFAIPFEDSNMLLFLLDKGIGSNGMITENQAAAVTSVSSESNATITKFNELKYFTSITATNTYTAKFLEWTALEEVDVSNFTRVGGATNGDWQGSFLRCTALKKVTASNKLTMFGHAAFNACSNLELITGVTGAVSVGCGAFKDCSKLPQSFFQPLIVTLTKTDSSGEQFSGCTLLQSIDIAEGTTVIPIKCFYNCTNLASITIPSTLTTVEGQAFYGCTSLTSIDLSNVTYIYLEAFRNTGLTGTLDLTSLSQTQAYPFNSCNSVTRMDFSSSIKTDMSNIGAGLCGYMTGLLTVTGLSHVTKIVSALFANDTNLSSIDIDWSKITRIEGSAFQGTSSLALSNLSIPNLTALNDTAFRESGVISVSDLGSITDVNGLVFWKCNNLVSVVLPNTVTTIKYDAFRECRNLQHVNLPTSCTSIEMNAFAECPNLDETYDLSNITTLGGGAFTNCNKLKISSFPRISTYSSSTFYGIANTSITIPKEVELIKGACFRNLPYLQSVSFEANSQLTTIEYDGFMSCPNLLSIVLPEGITTIGDNCFNSCDRLYYIEFPSTLTSISNGQYFGGLNNFIGSSTVVFRGTTPPSCSATNSGLFGLRSPQSISIYVPDASIQAYKAHTAFSLYADRIFGLSQLPNS